MSFMRIAVLIVCATGLMVSLSACQSTARLDTSAPLGLPSIATPIQNPGEGEAWTEIRTYKNTEHRDLDIHLDFPADWRPSDARPAIVFFFGGGWRGGSPGHFEIQAKYLATRGMVTARADYRAKILDRVNPDTCVRDALSAMRWVRAHHRELGIDPDRIVAAGGSAGGHLAACTALCDGLDEPGENLTVSAKPSAMVLFNPVLMFAGNADLTGRIGDDQALAEQISPTMHVRADTPPSIMFYGSNDEWLSDGEGYIARAKEVGNAAQIDITPGARHAFFNVSPHREHTLRLADIFLESLGYLEGPPTVKVP
jgi:acetyl esterase/lipase